MLEPIAPITPPDWFDAHLDMPADPAAWLLTFLDGTEEYLKATDLHHAITINADIATLELCL